MKQENYIRHCLMNAQMKRLRILYHFMTVWEIQPDENNEFMIGSERVENVNSIEDIQKISIKR